MKDINEMTVDEFEAALYKSIEDLANNKGPEEDRLTPAEIKARDKVRAEIKRLGLDEEDEHDARIIGNLFDKFIKEEEEK